MSGWSYAGGATSPKDYLDVTAGGNGPWNVDIWSVSSSPPQSIRFETTGINEFQVTVTDELGVSHSGTGYYDPQSGAAHGQFPYSGVSGVPMEFYMVASLARMTRTTNGSEETQWHLYALAMAGDPGDAGVIGAQGGG
jgi:hypothetical protein